MGAGAAGALVGGLAGEALGEKDEFGDDIEVDGTEAVPGTEEDEFADDTDFETFDDDDDYGNPASDEDDDSTDDEGGYSKRCLAPFGRIFLKNKAIFS